MQATAASARHDAALSEVSEAKDAAIASVQSALREAREKVSAHEAELRRLQELHKSAESNVESLQQSVHELETGLHAVTQEKTELLVQLADAKQQLRDGTHPQSDAEGDAWTAWPWRTDGARSAARLGSSASAGQHQKHHRSSMRSKPPCK